MAIVTEEYLQKFVGQRIKDQMDTKVISNLSRILMSRKHTPLQSPQCTKNRVGCIDFDMDDGCGLIQSAATVLFINGMHQSDSLKVNTRVTERCGASFILNYQVYKEKC